MDERSLGARLRRARHERHLTLAQVAGLTGEEFKASVLSAYERDERMLSVVRLLRLVSIYGITPDDILAPGTGAAGSAFGSEAEAHDVEIDLTAAQQEELETQELARWKGKEPDVPGFLRR